MLTRRTLAQGAAWTVPVVVVGVDAPAYAVSGCVVQTNFDALQVGSTPNVLNFSPSSITASLTYSSTGNAGDSTPGGTGKVARTSTTPAWNYLEVEMLDPLTKGDSVTVTITMSQAVENLSFRIHDIDTHTTDGRTSWVDHVVIGTPGFTYARGTDVTGVGTAGDPFRNTKINDQAIDSGKNHVDLTWVGPVSKVSFTYKAGADGVSLNQHIGVGNISFTDCAAASKANATGSLARRSFTGGTSRGRMSGGDD